MIRLVASDIDGTLIPYKCQKISDEFFEAALQLIESGVPFCFASGRQYDNLRRLAGPLLDKAYYMCENGAVVFAAGEKRELVAKTPMGWDDALRVADRILADPEYEVFISGENITYICPKTYAAEDLARNGLCNNVAVIPSPKDTPEPILKVSAWCRNSAEAYPKLAQGWEDKFTVAIAGENWVDFTLGNKGSGLRALCAHLGVELADVAAFGDNYNDLPMLDIVGHPYIMNSAAPELLARFENHCGNVAEELRKLL